MFLVDLAGWPLLQVLVLEFVLIAGDFSYVAAVTYLMGAFDVIRPLHVPALWSPQHHIRFMHLVAETAPTLLTEGSTLTESSTLLTPSQLSISRRVTWGLGGFGHAHLSNYGRGRVKVYF